MVDLFGDNVDAIWNKKISRSLSGLVTIVKEDIAKG